MKVLIWIAMAINIKIKPVHGERNPYKEALIARPWESEQKYVTVRPGAYMFYWLYYADGTRVGAESKPLIIWIQGGPGYAASGIANFAEIGPLTMNMEPRNHTWVNGRNVLLFDHPVGTGFSHVANNSLLVTTDEQAATDLFIAIRLFLMKHPEFRNTPTYLFGQNYGGKLCPIVAYYLHSVIEENRLEMNLKGIAIGSGLVVPRESLVASPEFLYTVGMIDLKTYEKAKKILDRMDKCIIKEDYTTALRWVNRLVKTFHDEDDLWINYDNVYQPRREAAMELLQRQINTYVKPTLSHVVDQNLEWKYISEAAWRALKQSFLVPSTKFLENLLNGSDLKVAIYNGNLVADTPVGGTALWVSVLRWHGTDEFLFAKRQQIRGTNNGHYKEAKQLSLWWVYRAGLWVPEDNPVAMEHILEYLTST